MASVVLATCAALPDGDEDGATLLAALTAAGVDARWQAWTDDRADWSADLCVIRSTWDYTLDREAYLRWVAAVPRLVNPARVVGWNSDKIYLRDLAAVGVPVVPTSWAAPGEVADLPSGSEFVVKPSVGAGSRGAGRFAAAEVEAALLHVTALHEAGRTVLVQPYLSGVDTAGETALVYFDGVFSHAIGKGAMLPEGSVHAHDARVLYVEERISARTPTAQELAVGSLVMNLLRDRFGGDLLYARVDLLPGADGPVLVELELTEPSLFLGYADGAADRFATAIARRLR
jgi:glutathione synthase/RimK-type ligase-like ATP-grasp enzyme